MTIVKWNYPTTVHFGCGSIGLLSDLLDDANIKKPLIVCDEGVAAAGLAERASSSAKRLSVVFKDVQANPSEGCIKKGVELYKTSACDGVIALGGGSPLDAGKAIALMVGQTRDLFDFEDIGDNYKRVNTEGMAKVVAIPTTSGTGSEVGRSSVIVCEKSQTKKIIFHANMLPHVALCDPELTFSLPPKLTAAVGIDALSHNLEAYCAPGFHPMADGIALEGMQRVFAHLERAVNEGTCAKARSEMMAASLMGATAFQKGLGAMHALAHPLGARLKAHHGLLNAIVMPYVLEFNRSKIEAKLTKAAHFCGFENPSFGGYLQKVIDLRKRLEIPNALDAIGLDSSRIEEIAGLAAVDPAGGGNPIALDKNNCASLLKRALDG